MVMSLKEAFQILSPVIFLCGGAFLMLMIDSFKKTAWSSSGLSMLSIIGALLGTFYYQRLFFDGKIVFGSFYADPVTWYFTVLMLLGTLLSVLLSSGKLYQEKIDSPAEFYSLLLMSTAGAVLFIASSDLIMMFLSLEIMSMALYCLCGAALTVRVSSESALKYFLLGSFSSAFLLYGFSFLYGLTGSFSLEAIALAAPNVNETVLKFALGLCLIGLLFKLGAVPFHFWAPDVYQGAPTTTTAYMACVVKAAAVGVLIRFLWVCFGDVLPYWSNTIWIVSVATLLIANVIAVRQKDVKRMLAYSSIGHAGYLCMPLLAPEAQFGGGSAILFYLIGYTLMTMGAFAVVLLVGNANSSDQNPTSLDRFKGLGKRNPILALTMSLFLLSLAGLPPGMIGLLGKFYIFSSAVKAGFVGLTIVAALCSAISCYYYLRVIVVMYFGDDEEIVKEVPSTFSTRLVLGACALGVIFLGVFPSLIYDQAAVVISSIF